MKHQQIDLAGGADVEGWRRRLSDPPTPPVKPPDEPDPDAPPPLRDPPTPIPIPRDPPPPPLQA